MRQFYGFNQPFLEKQGERGLVSVNPVVHLPAKANGNPAKRRRWHCCVLASCRNFLACIYLFPIFVSASTGLYRPQFALSIVGQSPLLLLYIFNSNSPSSLLFFLCSVIYIILIVSELLVMTENSFLMVGSCQGNSMVTCVDFLSENLFQKVSLFFSSFVFTFPSQNWVFRLYSLIVLCVFLYFSSPVWGFLGDGRSAWRSAGTVIFLVSFSFSFSLIFRIQVL